MNDSNLDIDQPSKPFTNKNSIHPPQRNGDVLSDRRELVRGSSSSAEFLFSACGDGSSTKFKKWNSNKCILANFFFKPTDKIVSSVTNRTYFCTNYEKSYVTSNSSNIIYLMTCSNCFMQYVGETAHNLNIRFATNTELVWVEN